MNFVFIVVKSFESLSLSLSVFLPPPLFTSLIFPLAPFPSFSPFLESISFAEPKAIWSLSDHK